MNTESETPSRDRVNLREILSLLKIIDGNSQISYQKVAYELGVSISTVKRILKKIGGLGIVISNEGSRRKPNYVVKDWGVIDKSALNTDKPNGLLEAEISGT